MAENEVLTEIEIRKNANSQINQLKKTALKSNKVRFLERCLKDGLATIEVCKNVRLSYSEFYDLWHWGIAHNIIANRTPNNITKDTIMGKVYVLKSLGFTSKDITKGLHISSQTLKRRTEENPTFWNVYLELCNVENTLLPGDIFLSKMEPYIVRFTKNEVCEVITRDNFKTYIQPDALTQVLLVNAFPISSRIVKSKDNPFFNSWVEPDYDLDLLRGADN